MSLRHHLLTVLLPLLVAGSAGAVFSRLGEQVAATVEVGPELEGVEVLVLGNSVGAAAVDAQQLQAVTGLTTVSLAEPGTQPAHWLAVLRHRVRLAGHHPREVVVYAPLHVLPHGTLVDPKEQALLLSLLVEPDRSLLDAALGPARRSRAERLRRGRVAAREGLVAWIGLAPPRLLVGPERVERALAAAPAVPLQVADRPASVPGDRRRGTPAHVEPASVPYGESFLPALLDETARLGARLWIVAPAVRPSGRPEPLCAHPPEVQALLDRLEGDGAHLLDLTWAPLEEEDFRSLQHPLARGRVAVTGWIGEAVRAGQVPAERRCRRPGGD